MADETLAEGTPEAPADSATPEGNLAGRWTDGLQEEALRVHPSLTKFQDVPSLAKSYVELESKIGSKGLLLPGDNATPSEIRQAMSQLGCPETPANLGAPQLPEGMPAFDESFLGAMRDVSWQNGLTPTQFQNLSQALVEFQGQAMAQAKASQDEGLSKARADLERRWGAATQEKLSLAQEAAQAIYGNAVNEAMQVQGEDGAIGNNPELLEVLSKLGQAMQEGGIVTSSRPAPTLTPQDAQDQINQAMLDKDFMAALHDERHMGHKEAYAKWSTLYNAANSGTQGPDRDQGGVFIR
tara:strand:+ start:5354 stop:6244 length:891 start_codon:yes stop_codon:yes gene_type:complete